MLLRLYNPCVNNYSLSSNNYIYYSLQHPNYYTSTTAKLFVCGNYCLFIYLHGNI